MRIEQDIVLTLKNIYDPGKIRVNVYDLGTDLRNRRRTRRRGQYPHDADGSELSDGRPVARADSRAGGQGEGRHVGQRHADVRPALGPQHDVGRDAARSGPDVALSPPKSPDMPVSPNEAFLRLVWTHGLYTRLDAPGIEVIDPGSAGPEDGIDAVNARIALEENGNQRSRCDPRARFGLAQAPAPHRQQIRPLHPACRGVRRRGRLPDGRIGRAYRHDELPPRTARAVSRPARGKRILPLRPDAGANAGSQAVRTADRADGRASRNESTTTF